MRTVVLERPGRLVPENHPRPEAGPEEALVRVRRVGVCGTDLHAFQGEQPFFDYPRILGHELAVEILDLPGRERRFAIGAHCAVEPYLSCGLCSACRRGRTNCCSHLQVLGVHRDGGMRECLSLPLDRLHPSEHLSLNQLALVEPLSIGAHAVARARLEPGEAVLVVGLGPIGLAVVQFALLEKALPAVLDVNPDRQAFAQRLFGGALTILEAKDVPSRLRQAGGGEWPTAVFDATGNPESMNRVFDWVAPGGRLIFVGFHQQEVRFQDSEFHRRELTILASRNSTGSEFRRVISLMEDGRIDAEPWVTHFVSPGDMIRQFPTWLKPHPGFMKAIVRW